MSDSEGTRYRIALAQFSAAAERRDDLAWSYWWGLLWEIEHPGKAR